MNADPAGDGMIRTAYVRFNTDTSVINGEVGYLKVGLHEIGHMLGLADNAGFNGSSVMNHLGADFERSNNTADDPFRNLPWDVTSCDRDRAKLSAEDTWPRRLVQ